MEMQAPPFKGLFARKNKEDKEQLKAERKERKLDRISNRENKKASRKEDRQYFKDIKRSCFKGRCLERKGGGYIQL